MPYAGFQELCPDIAGRETRTITLLDASRGLPAGSYQFIEMFCDERGCDCRRVMWSVFSSNSNAIEAVVAWGWESLDFYERWFGMHDPETVNEMKGPVLNLASPQTRNAPAILKLVETMLLGDAAYVERLKRHYALFREKVERGEGSKSARNRQRPSRSRASKWKAAAQNQGVSTPQLDRDRVGRNDPCPCGSGRKFKVCCMK